MKKDTALIFSKKKTDLFTTDIYVSCVILEHSEPTVTGDLFQERSRQQDIVSYCQLRVLCSPRASYQLLQQKNSLCVCGLLSPAVRLRQTLLHLRRVDSCQGMVRKGHRPYCLPIKMVFPASRIGLQPKRLQPSGVQFPDIHRSEFFSANDKLANGTSLPPVSKPLV